MAQHDDDRHLTTEQLSALLDQQLSSQEQTEYNAHLKTCQQCQNVMADLKLTVALLHALPQPTLPRSFVLPATTAHAQEQPGHTIRPLTTTTRRTPPHRLGHLARRSIRTISTIAAVIGLIFMLSSFLTTHSFGGATTNSSTGSIPASGPARGSATTPHVETKHTPTAASGQTPGVAVPVTPTPQIKHQPEQNSTGSPAIDLNSPQVHLGLGAILLLIGVLGVALTRKRSA